MKTHSSKANSAPDPAMVEKYQQMLEENPSSKVFAPLADAYRQLDMKDEALKLCEKGVREHPDFPGGRIALANIYIDLDRTEDAFSELYKANLRTPDNLAVLSKIAEISLLLKKPRQALDYYKELLSLSPTHSKALRAIDKIEAHFRKHPEDEEDYKMQRLQPLQETNSPSTQSKEVEEAEETNISTRLERRLSLSDAYFARNDFEKANEVLIAAENDFGSLPEIVKRLKALHLRQLDAINPPKSRTDLRPLESRELHNRNAKVKKLEALLSKFKSLQEMGEEDLKL